MVERRKHVKRATQFVTAVQVDLELDGFTYRKWGGTQRCKRGDWLVNNNGEVYTVEPGPDFWVNPSHRLVPALT